MLLGEFGRAHGLAGEVRLRSYTEDPLAIAGYGPLHGDDGRTYELAAVRPAPGAQPDMLIARLPGVTSREAAERLNGLGLRIARARLPATEEDEFLLADLIGLDVVDLAGERLGLVASVPDYGGGTLLEIRPAAGRPTVLVPFTRRFVPAVDIAARRVVVDPPADLFDPPGFAGPRGSAGPPGSAGPTGPSDER